MATAPALLKETRPGLLYPHAQWYFLLAMAITWLGFSRSYFSVVRTEPLLHHVHGALMGGWIALLVLQPVLYQRGRIQLHRTLGRWGVYLLMPAIVICGFLMDQRMLRMHNAPPSVLDQLAFLDLMSLIVFPALVLLSIYHARNVQLHARYIVCTVLLFMPPALTRALFILPSMRSFQVNVNTAEALVILVLLLLIVDDLRRGRTWAPYPLALVVFATLAITSNYAKNWAWWHGLSRWMTGNQA
jgi:CDP-diglyceride synthetase